MSYTIPRIDYRKIADAISYYTKIGYREVEVPWIVNHEAYSVTRPADRPEFYTIGGYLNASGEQSFIQMMQEGVNIDKCVCVTPCFRKEPELDETHSLYFMKVELIDTNVSKKTLTRIIRDAKLFFEKYTDVNVIQTDTDGLMFDIVDKQYGIELGSYGIRHYENLSWVYGTGLALPRLDIVLNKKA